MRTLEAALECKGIKVTHTNTGHYLSCQFFVTGQGMAVPTTGDVCRLCQLHVKKPADGPWYSTVSDC